MTFRHVNADNAYAIIPLAGLCLSGTAECVSDNIVRITFRDKEVFFLMEPNYSYF